MINLNQLRAFYQAAKCRNLSIAAQALFVSQPAVTAQIKLFEENCGLKLFKKKGRNLHGEGVSFLVKEAVAVELKENKLATAPLKTHSIFLDVNIAYLKNQPLSTPAQAFLKSLEALGTKKMRFQGMGALMAKMLARER
jgi:DNA-binding transcriptional LysR family regulator